jgi:hypothetical protein
MTESKRKSLKTKESINKNNESDQKNKTTDSNKENTIPPKEINIPSNTNNIQSIETIKDKKPQGKKENIKKKETAAIKAPEKVQKVTKTSPLNPITDNQNLQRSKIN